MPKPGIRGTVAAYLKVRILSLGVAAIILIWYDIQILSAAMLELTVADVRYLFKITSLSKPNPGWLFAVVSHAFPPRYYHILTNVVGVVVFGGAMERHLSRRELLGFFVVVGVGSLFVQVAYGLAVGQRYAVNGASGAVFGFTTMYCAHYLLAHGEVLELPARLDSARALFLQTRTVFAYLGPPVIVAFLVLQLSGVLPSGSSAVLTHLVGALTGIAIAAVRPIYSSDACSME